LTRNPEVTGLTEVVSIIYRGDAWRFHRPTEGTTNFVAEDAIKPVDRIGSCA